MGKLICLLLLIGLCTFALGAFNPGNTQKNCIPARRCALCRGFTARSGFRTMDGTCNNLRRRIWGATNTPLRRLMRPQYHDDLDSPRGGYGFEPDFNIPHANDVSKYLFQVERNNKGNAKHLSVLFMTFGQFLDHDLSLSPHASCKTKSCPSSDSYKYPCFPMKFSGSKDCTGFGRTQPVCQYGDTKKTRQQLNVITSFIDGSNIYGSSIKRMQSLRKYEETGELLMTKANLLPLAESQLGCRVIGGCSRAGDDRVDENIALMSMHTLWAREHNRIAKKLKQLNKKWNGEKIFQTSRKIVGALLQHIVYEEYLPLFVNLGKYRRYKRHVNPSIINAFSAAAFRFGHSLVPTTFAQVGPNFDKLMEPVHLQEAFFNKALINARGIDSTLLGLIGNRSSAVDTGFTEGLARKLFLRPGKAGHADLPAMNIQRGRDHGLRTYGEWRQVCHLPRIRGWGHMEKIMQPGAVTAFKKLYKNPNDIDLYAGAIAERHKKVWRRVNGRRRRVELQVGPTFECIFNKQFSALRDGDRFFYRNPGVFKPNQLEAIRKVTFSKIFCDNIKMVSVQRESFIAGSDKIRRVSCGEIPELDISAWKDEPDEEEEEHEHNNHIEEPTGHYKPPRGHYKPSYGYRPSYNYNYYQRHSFFG